MKTDNQRTNDLLRSPDFTDFCRKHEILLAILHGSRATASARDDSDFDLALLLERDLRKDTMEAGVVKRSLLHELIKFLSSSRVDLTILNTASTFLAYQVIQSGILLFEAEEGAYARFASLNVRRLSDEKLFREAEKKYISMKV